MFGLGAIVTVSSSQSAWADTVCYHNGKKYSPGETTCVTPYQQTCYIDRHDGIAKWSAGDFKMPCHE
jgi:hypothetical protein